MEWRRYPRGVLLHELSHLHINQRLGFLGGRKNIPVWFQEGLANFVCNCGGEGIEDEMAIRAIKNGYHFIPDKRGNLFKVKRAPDYGMDYPMFHKQSKLFVTYLHEYSEMGFQNFLLDIQSGNSFAESIINHFGNDITELWKKFVEQL